MKRVITYGTFDLLHYGHVNILRRAKELGDYLVVAISTDEFNWNEKGKKCYFTYEQRKVIGTDWTVKKVKEYKKTLVATSQQTENEENIDFEMLDAVISAEPEEKYAKCKPAEMRSLLRMRDNEIARLKDEIRSLREGEELVKLREELDYFRKLAITNMANDSAAD